MDPRTKIAPDSNLASSIVATLDSYALCEQIVLFLLKNESAMDTVKGIASWWLGCEEMAAQDALDRLVGCGVLAAHTLTAGTVYRLTRNPEIRAWLRALYSEGTHGQPSWPPDLTAGAIRRKVNV